MYSPLMHLATFVARLVRLVIRRPAPVGPGPGRIAAVSAAQAPRSHPLPDLV